MHKVEVGDIFTDLVVKHLSIEHNGSYKQQCECLCVCGSLVHTTIGTLVYNQLKSCGCRLSRVTIERNTTHGMSRTRQYATWANMKARCDNPLSDFYHLYGGRGITYTPFWKDFDGFWEDMGGDYFEDATIERIDPNKNYCKDNCTWVSAQQQSRNKTLHISNSTGVNGVHFVSRDNAFVAKIATEVGATKRKNFAVKKYGYDEAFRQAVSWRKKQEELLANTEVAYGEKHGCQKTY